MKIINTYYIPKEISQLESNWNYIEKHLKNCGKHIVSINDIANITEIKSIKATKGQIAHVLKQHGLEVIDE